VSPANRVNPGLTNAAGEFGWDTLADYYKVEASKEDCGTATTRAFKVPPPALNLELVMHCVLRIETSSLPEAKPGEPYEAKLAATRRGCVLQVEEDRLPSERVEAEQGGRALGHAQRPST
jgi:hypothetical protein